jgi:hypothetical protein
MDCKSEIRKYDMEGTRVAGQEICDRTVGCTISARDYSSSLSLGCWWVGEGEAEETLYGILKRVL